MFKRVIFILRRIFKFTKKKGKKSYSNAQIDQISEKDKFETKYFLLSPIWSIAQINLPKLVLLLFQTLINNHNPHANFTFPRYIYCFILLHHMQFFVEQKKHIYVIVQSMQPERKLSMNIKSIFCALPERLFPKQNCKR